MSELAAKSKGQSENHKHGQFKDNRPVVIIDFGSQYTQLLAKAIRKAGVYSIIYPCYESYEKIKETDPQALVFSGGPESVYDENRPKFDERLFSFTVPILGICYGMQLIVDHFGGEIDEAAHREYGLEQVEVLKASDIFSGVKKNTTVWMSHSDEVKKVPSQFEVLAKTKGSLSALAHQKKPVYTLQFHPEVSHSEEGQKIIENFLFKVVKAQKNWSLENFVEKKIQALKEQIGDKRVMLAISGGVDSSVLAVLLSKAIGNKLLLVIVDNGLLRENEVEGIIKNFKDKLGLTIQLIKAEKLFLSRLRFVKDPERKRRIIGNLFLKIFLRFSKKFDYLAQGTLYPDLIESVSVFGPSDTIKTHHNLVKGMLALKKQNRLLEPFSLLFKDEVREIGRVLEVPDSIIERKPFPGPGLAIRILGRVTPYRLYLVRMSDKILEEELSKTPFYKSLWQSFTVLIPLKSVGVVGDKRSYGYTIVLRLVSSVNGMTADFELPSKAMLTKITSRIVGELGSIARVTLDVTSKPPATIEWE